MSDFALNYAHLTPPLTQAQGVVMLQDLSRFSCAGRGLWVGVSCVYIGIHLPSEKGMWGWVGGRGEEEGGNLNPGNPHNGIC